ncbi:MAG: helix-turn-helix transcriptional regulator [Bacteroidetes bacterium]|nr:helix-turn-helix transcriptional regulator [Bacteroidota bacterium]
MSSKVLEKIKNRIPSFKKRMMEISFDITAQIYEYMKNGNNMTQKELAKKLNKKESEISKWLSGGHNFTLETVAKIEEVLNQKILIVPMFAREDLGIKYSSSKTVTIIVSPTKIADVEYSDFLIKNSENLSLKYLKPSYNSNTIH